MSAITKPNTEYLLSFESDYQDAIEQDNFDLLNFTNTMNSFNPLALEADYDLDHNNHDSLTDDLEYNVGDLHYYGKLKCAMELGQLDAKSDFILSAWESVIKNKNDEIAVDLIAASHDGDHDDKDDGSDDENSIADLIVSNNETPSRSSLRTDDDTINNDVSNDRCPLTEERSTSIDLLRPKDRDMVSAWMQLGSNVVTPTKIQRKRSVSGDDNFTLRAKKRRRFESSSPTDHASLCSLSYTRDLDEFKQKAAAAH